MGSKNKPNLRAASKKTKRSQKAEMKKISDPQELRATFKQRVAELFMEAFELSVLCGVAIAIVVISPDNEVYSYGNPDVNSVIERYLKKDSPPSSNPDHEETDNAVDKEQEEKMHDKEKGDNPLFACESSSSIVNGPITMDSTPLKQDNVHVIDGNVASHNHHADNMDDEGYNDEVTSKLV